tara:strand:+ start:66 stop:488 length:423 start_codon:yes stop_codon:yes gene_type:complete
MKREDLISHIKKVLTDRSISTDIKSCQFKINPLPMNDIKGVYIIRNKKTDMIVNVGKSDVNINARIKVHWNKATGKWKGKDSTGGWNYLLENYDYNVKDLEFLYVELPLHRKRTSVEAILIDDLEPVANDETFNDRFIKE